MEESLFAVIQSKVSVQLTLIQSHFPMSKIIRMFRIFLLRFYIVVLGMTFIFFFSQFTFSNFYLDIYFPFSVGLSFPYSIWIFISLFFLDFFPFSIWTFISFFLFSFFFNFFQLFFNSFSIFFFSILFYSIAVTFWISFNFLLKSINIAYHFLLTFSFSFNKR